MTRLHDWFLATWYGGTARGRWLLPAAWLFAGVTSLRRQMYAWGWLARYRSRRPVVVVGNLTVGGTGKTPLVIWLARGLASREVRVGIALRGYGREGSQARRVSPSDSAALVGDEALMLERKLGVPVAVASLRPDAVRLLEDDCDLVLCDDGLQHHALERDFEVAVVDGRRGLGNGMLLPAGPLREPVARLADVDAVVINGDGFDWPSAIRMRLEPVSVIALRGGSRRPLSDFTGGEVLAVAAIGNPERFFSLLRAHGLRIQPRQLPDHGRFTEAEVRVEPGKPLLMTEKDAVKCTGEGWAEAYYLEVAACIDDPAGTHLLERVAALAGRPTGSKGHE